MAAPYRVAAVLRAGRRTGRSAPLLVIATAVSIQSGAALATKLFATAGPLGTVWLRTAFAALVLLGVGHRRIRLPRRGRRLRLALLGVVLAAMNACFYEGIARAPLGVVATIEFLGPLTIALAGSRRRSELLWVALAAAGVAVLGDPSVHLDSLGLGFAFAAAALWAAYIVIAKRIVSDEPLLSTMALALALGAVVLAPGGIATGGSALLRPWVLGLGFAVAILSSAAPYVLELLALRLVRASTFGVLLSLEPAVAAIMGALIASQRLHPLEIVAVVLVVCASMGASRRAAQPVA